MWRKYPWEYSSTQSSYTYARPFRERARRHIEMAPRFESLVFFSRYVRKIPLLWRSWPKVWTVFAACESWEPKPVSRKVSCTNSLTRQRRQVRIVLHRRVADRRHTPIASQYFVFITAVVPLFLALYPLGQRRESTRAETGIEGGGDGNRTRLVGSRVQLFRNASCFSHQ